MHTKTWFKEKPAWIFKVIVVLGLSFSIWLTESCGPNEQNRDSSKVGAIEAEGTMFSKGTDRVYLAVDEVNVFGQNTRVFYVIGCHKEGPITDAVSVYHPLDGYKSIPMHKRKWLYEFNPLNDPLNPEPGDCEVLFGGPSFQRFLVVKANLESKLTKVGFAGATFVASLKAGYDIKQDLKASAYIFKDYIKANKIKHPLTMLGGVGSLFYFGANSYGYKKLVTEEKKQTYVGQFSRMFDHAAQTARSILEYEENHFAKTFKQSLQESRVESDDIALMKAMGYLAEKTVEVFNQNDKIWKSSSNDQVAKGTFRQDWLTDLIHGSDVFFQSIKLLRPVKWAHDEASFLYDIPDQYRATTRVKCNSLSIRDHHLTRLRGGAPVYKTKEFNHELGNLAIGTELYMRLVKERSTSGEVPAIQVRILDEEITDRLGLSESESVWLHPAFVETTNPLPCNPSID